MRLHKGRPTQIFAIAALFFYALFFVRHAGFYIQFGHEACNPTQLGALRLNFAETTTLVCVDRGHVNAHHRFVGRGV